MKKIDLGCGYSKRDKESLGVDIVALPGVDVVCDINQGLPFADNEIDEVYSRHFLEHVDDIFFVMKEIYRVIKPDGRVIIKVPYFATPTAYSDLTHRRFFGIYSFQCFDPNHAKHDYHQVGDTKFKLVEVKYSFHYGFLSRLFEFVFNKIQNKYERYLCYFFPAYDLRFTLKPVK
ncbi:MAG: class I SAM-dependent methyltransferase [Candidatus Buchananbacteria bacterium]